MKQKPSEFIHEKSLEMLNAGGTLRPVTRYEHLGSLIYAIIKFLDEKFGDEDENH